jgi:hypothetical protein
VLPRQGPDVEVDRRKQVAPASLLAPRTVARMGGDWKGRLQSGGPRPGLGGTPGGARIDIRQPPQVAAVSQPRVFRSATIWGYSLRSLEILILECF